MRDEQEGDQEKATVTPIRRAPVATDMVEAAAAESGFPGRAAEWARDVLYAECNRVLNGPPAIVKDQAAVDWETQTRAWTLRAGRLRAYLIKMFANAYTHEAAKRAGRGSFDLVGVQDQARMAVEEVENGRAEAPDMEDVRGKVRPVSEAEAKEILAKRRRRRKT